MEENQKKCHLNQEDLHRYVRSIGINVKDFLQIIIQIHRISYFIKNNN